MKIHLIYSLVLCLVFSCGNDNSSKEVLENNNQAKFLNSSVSVNIEIIESKSFNKQIVANGKIEAANKSELRFKASERLSSIKVKNGQKVNKGQTLAVLDNAILANQLNKAKIEFDKSKSKLQEEKINFGVGDSINESIEPTILKNLKINSGYFEAENVLENAQLLYNQTILKHRLVVLLPM